MNKSINVYGDSSSYAISHVQRAFPNHKVIQNGPARPIEVDGYFKTLRMITIIDITPEEFRKGKQRKPIRDLKAEGLIRNFGA